MKFKMTRFLPLIYPKNIYIYRKKIPYNIYYQKWKRDIKHYFVSFFALHIYAPNEIGPN